MTRITDIPELEGYGVFVDDIDFKTLSLREWKELGQLHLQKLVMVIRKSGLKNKKVFYKVLSKWGEHRQNYAAILFDKYPWAEGQAETLLSSSEVSPEDKEYIREFYRIGGVNPKEGNI